jgi:uncharacterized membrane protein YccF (DUF307 family)
VPVPTSVQVGEPTGVTAQQPTPAPAADVQAGVPIQHNSAFQQTTVVMVQRGEPNLLIRIIWFLFVGWWLSNVVVLVGWVLNLTLIGLPLGLFLLNRIPQVATLKMSAPHLQMQIDLQTGAQVISIGSRPQRPFWQRALYFLVVGWWFSLLWLEVAWLLCIIILGMPIGFWMYGASGKVTTLKR